MGNSSSINANHTDRPPDEIFQIKVSNAGNTCYMDAVLFSMFAMPSPVLDALLTKRQPAADHLAVQKQELQACILKQFVGRLRHCESVTAESMSNIRGMCRRVGWEYPGAPDMQQDAGEFFAFLYSCLGGQLIKTTRRTFTGALPDNSDRGHEENMALLPVGLCDSNPQRNDELNLASLVDTFFFENFAAGLRRKVQGHQQEVFALNTYSVENVPSVVAVSLKRFDEQLLKIESQVDFPSQLNLHKYSSRLEWRSSPIMQSVPWVLKSVVCHRGRSTQSGHYYAYTRYSKNDSPSAVWLRLDDESTPCITQTNIWQDPYVKSEAVLFLYELDTDAHTAAMMMLQEEEDQGMYESGDAYGFDYGGFGQGSFGNGGSAGAYEIPQSLSSSILSASYSTHQCSPGKPINTGASNTGANDTEPSLPSPASPASPSTGSGSAVQESNQVEEPKMESPKEEGSKASVASEARARGVAQDICTQDAIANAASAEAAHPSLSLEEIEFVVTPNGQPMVAARKLQHCEEQSDVASSGKMQWGATFEVDEKDVLVCVSAMASLRTEAAHRQAKVSIMRFEDKRELCSCSLSADIPSTILAVGGGSETRGRRTLVATFTEQ